jgi:hypothetical protein
VGLVKKAAKKLLEKKKRCKQAQVTRRATAIKKTLNWRRYRAAERQNAKRLDN